MPSDFTIANGNNIPLNVQTGTIPNMGDALSDWYQNIVFGLVTKTVNGFQADETVTDIAFRGIIQPLSGRQLMMKEEGQRRWNWLSVTAQAAPNGALINLGIDDIILFRGKQYRVMAKKDYTLYSYTYMEMAEDYTQSGPPTP